MSAALRLRAAGSLRSRSSPPAPSLTRPREAARPPDGLRGDKGPGRAGAGVRPAAGLPAHRVDLQVLLHGLATDAVCHRYGETVAAFHPVPPSLAACPGIGDSPAHQALTEAETLWRTRLPQAHGHCGTGCGSRACRRCWACWPSARRGCSRCTRRPSRRSVPHPARRLGLLAPDGIQNATARPGALCYVVLRTPGLPAPSSLLIVRTPSPASTAGSASYGERGRRYAVLS